MVKLFNSLSLIKELENSQNSEALKAKLNERDYSGRTILHTACHRGDNKLLNLLIDRGADCHAIDDLGWNSMHHACQRGSIEIIKTLLDHKVDFNTTDNQGWTVMHCLVYYGHLEAVELLINAGAKTNTKTFETKWNLLELTSYNNTYFTQRYILENVFFSGFKIDYAKTEIGDLIASNLENKIKLFKVHCKFSLSVIVSIERGLTIF